ncbi:aspartate kinase [Acidianus ambivalens]|uniref:Aspartokinase n=1 Tax=Acidianus ambivalens TaxID=2283 RepID=A0A650CSV4_ACIAM|nr:aspartate kinase [Acidianus ambivalens]MQL55349.1 aspartate kinase [Acidianus ambivalens]QGR20888.1 aspartate kinase [Acidianus ambivalens]
MIIIKIGGSIQKDERDYELISEKIEKYSNNEDKVLVITSAMRGITNDLISATENRDKSTEIIGNIYDKHIKILSKVADGPEFEIAFKDLSKMADELFKIAWSIRVLDEITPRVRDYILSFGERMATIVLNATLRSRRLDSIAYPEPPLVTDNNFGEANVLEDLTLKEINEKILSKKSKILIIPGFIGKTIDEKYTTIGRGGSDYTATLLGKLLNVENVRLVTEVPGIMTADPRKIESATTIKRLSLEEAVELAQMGAKRLHPRTFEPMFSSNMKVTIEGLYEEGETIVSGSCEDEDKLKGVTILDDLKMINIESTRIVGKIGSAARVMAEAKNSNVNIVSISQPASETTISLVVNSNDAEILATKLKEIKDIDNIEIKDVSAVSIVGCGLRNNEIFKEVENVALQYDILSMSRGLKNVSATFIVKKEEGYNLAKSLHEVVLKWIN